MIDELFAWIVYVAFSKFIRAMFPVNNVFRNPINCQAQGDTQGPQNDQARLQTLINAIEQNQTPRAEALDNLAAFIVLNDQGAVTSPQMQEAVEYLADHLNDHEVVMVNRAPWGAARLASFATDNAVGFLQQGSTVENRQRMLRCITRLLQQAPEDRNTFELRGASFSRAQLEQFVARLNAPALANNANGMAAAEYDRIMRARGGWDATQNVHVGVVEQMAVDVFNHMATIAQPGLSVQDAKAAIDNWLRDSDLPRGRRDNARSVLHPRERTGKHDVFDERLPVVVGYVLATPDAELRENLFVAMVGALDELGSQGSTICSVGWNNRIILFPIGIDPATNLFGANEEVNERVVALAASSNQALSDEVDGLVATPGLNVLDISGLIDEHRQNFVHASVFELVLIGGVQLNTVVPAVRQNVEFIDADIPGAEQAGMPTDVNALIDFAVTSILPPAVQRPAQPAPVVQPAPVAQPPLVAQPAPVAQPPLVAPRHVAVANTAPNRFIPELQEYHHQDLRYAIDALDTDRVIECLQNINPQDLNFEVVEGKTALQYLISEASETDPRVHQILNYLCDAGVNVNENFDAHNRRSFQSALEIAVRNYKVSFVEALLARGADPNLRLSLFSISIPKRGIDGNITIFEHKQNWIRILSFVRSDEFKIGRDNTSGMAINRGPFPCFFPIRKPTTSLYYRNPSFAEIDFIHQTYQSRIAAYQRRRQIQLNVEIRKIKALRIEKALIRAGANETPTSYMRRFFN